MRILRNIQVPTGNIMIGNGEKGNLEFLSIGDYGKEVNLKCDALGLDKDIEQVKHTEILPLTKKWVITISSQYGCSMGCLFCDVPKVGAGLNATLKDLEDQVATAMTLHPEITYSERLNIHYARMGEPTFNNNVLNSAITLYDKYNKDFLVHPVVSTMMPRHNSGLEGFIHAWIAIKNIRYSGNAGLQLSINSTNEYEREAMFNGNALTLEEIAGIMQAYKPIGRKFTLNFAVADFSVDAELLRKFFNPKHFIIKLTPMHKTTTALENGIETFGDYTTMYPYKQLEEDLKAVGFDVLVFIASEAEDLGMITCGNAILTGKLPQVPYKEIE